MKPKIEPIEEYAPEYPKKRGIAAKIAGLAAAALLVAGTSAGCRPELGGAPLPDSTPIITEEPALEGDVIADTEAPVDETETAPEATEAGGDNEGDAGDIFGDAGITGVVLADPGTVGD